MIVNLKNKKALVTGGGTGIGQGIAKALADAGAQVAFTSRKKSSLNETFKLLGSNKKHLPCKIDLFKKGSVDKLYKKLKKEFGTIDIVINNIGHGLNKKDPFTPIVNWENSMRLNFLLPVEVVNRFVGDMRKQNWGRIINITSIAGMEISGPSTYNASKAALTVTFSKLAVIVSRTSGLTTTFMFVNSPISIKTLFISESVMLIDIFCFRSNSNPSLSKGLDDWSI